MLWPPLQGTATTPAPCLTSDQFPTAHCEGQGTSRWQGAVDSGLERCWQSACCKALCSSSPTLWMHSTVLFISPDVPHVAEHFCHSPTHHLGEDERCKCVCCSQHLPRAIPRPLLPLLGWFEHRNCAEKEQRNKEQTWRGRAPRCTSFAGRRAGSARRSIAPPQCRPAFPRSARSASAPLGTQTRLGSTHRNQNTKTRRRKMKPSLEPKLKAESPPLPLHVPLACCQWHQCSLHAQMEKEELDTRTVT